MQQLAEAYRMLLELPVGSEATTKQVMRMHDAPRDINELGRFTTKHYELAWSVFLWGCRSAPEVMLKTPDILVTVDGMHRCAILLALDRPIYAQVVGSNAMDYVSHEANES